MGMERVDAKPANVLREVDIQRDVRDALSKHPAVQKVWRVNGGGAFVPGVGGVERFLRFHDIPGMSDLWVLLKPRYGPRMGFVEVKRPGEKPTEKQAALLETMRDRGHIAFVATSAMQAWTELSQQIAAWEPEGTAA